MLASQVTVSIHVTAPWPNATALQTRSSGEYRFTAGQLQHSNSSLGERQSSPATFPTHIGRFFHISQPALRICVPGQLQMTNLEVGKDAFFLNTTLGDLNMRSAKPKLLK
jgi:hypothetical protein